MLLPKLDSSLLFHFLHSRQRILFALGRSDRRRGRRSFDRRGRIVRLVLFGQVAGDNLGRGQILLPLGRRPVVFLIGSRFFLGHLLILGAEIIRLVGRVVGRVRIGFDELERRRRRVGRPKCVRRELDVELRRMAFLGGMKPGQIGAQRLWEQQHQQDVNQNRGQHPHLDRTFVGILRKPWQAETAARALGRWR